VNNHISISRRKSAIEGRALVLFLVFVLLCCGERPAGTQQTESVPDLPQLNPDQGYNTITIIPSTRLLRDIDWVPASGEIQKMSSGPLGRQTELSVSIQSGMPSWGASIEAVKLRGPGGRAPSGSFLVRTELTGGQFQPLEGPIPIVAGDYSLPARQAKVEIAFSPSWQDPAGEYRGKLVVRPAIPDQRGRTMTALDQTAGLIGTDQEIDFSFYHSQTIMLQRSTDELSLTLSAGPREQQTEDEVTLWLWTNANEWLVMCSATPLLLEGGGHEIPPSRITWERLDEHGRVVQSGNLGTSAVVLEGWGPVEGAEWKLRFTMPVTMRDVAGRYGGRLELSGLVAGPGGEARGEEEIATPGSGD